MSRGVNTFQETIPHTKDFEEFVRKIELMFEDEKLMNYWLHRIHDWSEEQIERINEYEVKHDN